MNLTGHWKGKYIFGLGYPPQFVGKSEPFEFDIVDNDGVISGTCNDKLVKAQAGNESYILGTFKQNQILFKKRYKFHLLIDESGNYTLNGNTRFDGVDYSGKLYKKFFSRKLYFSGEWKIVNEFEDENNLTQVFKVYGKWTMTKMD